MGWLRPWLLFSFVCVVFFFFTNLGDANEKNTRGGV